MSGFSAAEKQKTEMHRQRHRIDHWRRLGRDHASGTSWPVEAGSGSTLRNKKSVDMMPRANSFLRSDGESSD